jgi:hypothetical protein
MAGPPGLPFSLDVTHSMVSDPEEAALPRLSGCADVDFRYIDGVVLPMSLFAGLNPFNLPAYGLRACWPTLRAEHYCSPPKVWLLSGWLGLPRWVSHPLDYPVLPGRFQHVKRDPCQRKDASWKSKSQNSSRMNWPEVTRFNENSSTTSLQRDLPKDGPSPSPKDPHYSVYDATGCRGSFASILTLETYGN